jgi:hypothetical protein
VNTAGSGYSQMVDSSEHCKEPLDCLNGWNQPSLSIRCSMKLICLLRKDCSINDKSETECNIKETLPVYVYVNAHTAHHCALRPKECSCFIL